MSVCFSDTRCSRLLRWQCRNINLSWAPGEANINIDNISIVFPASIIPAFSPSILLRQVNYETRTILLPLPAGTLRTDNFIFTLYARSQFTLFTPLQSDAFYRIVKTITRPARRQLRKPFKHRFCLFKLMPVTQDDTR